MSMFTRAERRRLAMQHHAEQRSAQRRPDRRRDAVDSALFVGGFLLVALMAVAGPAVHGLLGGWLVVGILLVAVYGGARLSYRFVRDELQDFRDWRAAARRSTT